ncbi:MAG TPA: O-antigen ligase family protein [Gaiellaceae bacterium]|nr:O-antigen ligase family protein [Gaiellaceae bacterium]
MTAELARAGGPLACAGLAALYLAPARPWRLAGLAAWALGSLVLALYLAPHGHHLVLAAAAVLGLGLAAALAALFVRWPWLFALAALACVPARIPVHVGSTTANLLVPLYGVVVAGALAFAWEEQRAPRARELGPLALPLAAFVLWTGLSLAWSQDLRQGAISLLFYYLPFGVVALAVARLRPERRRLLALYGELVLMAVAFAVVGVYQWATRDIFWNPKVIVANAYAPFFRVNSVFYDPSVYGRFLVVALLATLVPALGSIGLRKLAAAAAAVALLWLGLLFSFSQSSFAALTAGILVAAALTWRRRALVAIAVGAAVLLAAGVATPRIRSAVLGHSRVGLNHASSDRYRLVKNGIQIAITHPAGGVGVGAFKHAYAQRLHLKGQEPKSAASHDTPVTVAAETGLPGLLLLAWLCVVGFSVPLRLRSSASRIVGVALVAIAVHSLFYNAFFEDPMVWGLLGLAGVFAREQEA